MPWIASRFVRPFVVVALLFLGSVSSDRGDGRDRGGVRGVASTAVRWPSVAPASADFARSGDALVVDGALPARVGPSGSIAVASRGTALTLTLESIGRRANRAHRTTVEAGRAIVDRGDVREWLVSTNTGLEHGFDLARRVAGAGEVAIRIAVDGARTIQAGRDVAIVDANGAPRFEYRELVVVDATGAELRSRMRARGDAIELAFDDRDAVYPVRVDPLLITAFQTLSEAMAELEANSLCGASVALRGDIAVVGCPFDDGPSLANVGAVLVFKRDSGLNTWSAAGRLVPPTPSAEARFGRSVAFDGTSIVVGAPGIPAAFVYRLVNTTWTLHAPIAPPRPTGSVDFGWSVAVDSDNVLVGAPDGIGPTGPNATGYVARYTAAGAFVDETSGPTGAQGDRFGESVALLGTTAVVGAPRRDLDPGGASVTDAGAAYEYTLGASPAFVRELPDPSRVATGGYGADVAIGSAGIVVGKIHGGANTGLAFVFSRVAANVTPITLAADDTVSDDLFGASVAIDGPLVLVGAPRVAVISPTPGAGAHGAAYLFVQDGTTFVQAAKLTPGAAADNDANGFDVAIDASNATTRLGLIGAPLDDEGSPSSIGNAGTAKVFGIPPYHFVHVTIPNGGGSVASTPAGIACPNDCVEVYGTSANVTLTPTAFSGYFLEAVTGSCTAIPCSFDTSADRAVAFDFHAQFQDGALCDDSVQCLNGTCVDGVCCNEPCAGGDSDCQACSIAAGGTINGSCTALSNTAAPTVTCRTAVDTCDVDDRCMPLNRECPEDAWRPIDFECRPAQSSVCDKPEVCDGNSPMCPPDVVEPDGVSCDDGNACSGTETCDGLGACVSSNPVTCIDDGNPCTVEVCLNVVGCVSVARPGCAVVDGGAVFPGDGGTAIGPDLRGGGGCTCTTSGGRIAIHPVLLAGFAIVALLVASRRNRLRRKAIARPR